MTVDDQNEDSNLYDPQNKVEGRLNIKILTKAKTPESGSPIAVISIDSFS